MPLDRTTHKAVATAVGLTMITGLAVATTRGDEQSAPVTVASTSTQSLVPAPAELVRRDRSFARASRSRTAAAALRSHQAAAAAAAEKVAAEKVAAKRAAAAAAAKEAERRAAVHQAAHDKARQDRTARDRAAGSRRATTGAAPQPGSDTTAPPAVARASSSSSDAGRGALAEAPSHQGKPYQYGATGPDRFDCSGFTRYLFARQGTQLPRVSRDQYAASTKVEQGAKQPGDLIFTYGSSGIYHVGIYAGGGAMWASTKTGDVVRRQAIWTTQYYVGRFS